MSLAKIHRQRASGRKGVVLVCEKGKEEIHKGDEYFWFKVGFRSSVKHVRCLKHPPQQSERESSLMSGVYAAQESASDELDNVDRGDLDGLVDAVEQIVHDAAEGFTEVADQYREASESMGSAGEEMAEKADTLEHSASELESWRYSGSDLEGCADHEENTKDCEACEKVADEWADDVIAEARSAVDEAETP